MAKYYATENGEIYNQKTGYLLKQFPHKRRGSSYQDTYLYVVLTIDKHQFHTPAHRFIWEYFYGLIPKGYEIHHIDGNASNNALDNLIPLSPKDHHKASYDKQYQEKLKQEREQKYKRVR